MILPAFFLTLLLYMSWSDGRLQQMICSVVLPMRWRLDRSCEVIDLNQMVMDEVSMDSMI